MSETARGKRRSIRLRDFDYAGGGLFFVTICASEQRSIFGEVNDGEMVLNDLGRIVEDEWLRTLEMRPYIDLDAFVVIPNHFHGVVLDQGDTLGSVGARCARPLSTSDTVWSLAEQGARSAPLRLARRSLGSLIAGFKAAVTRRASLEGAGEIGRIWQRNYYEHVIRNERDLERICHYVASNPAQWMDDGYHPSRNR